MGRNFARRGGSREMQGAAQSLLWEFAPMVFEGEVWGEVKRINLEGFWIYFARFAESDPWAGPFLSQEDVESWANSEQLEPLLLEPVGDELISEG